MEIISAINARLVEYAFDIVQVQRGNPVRLRNGERESFFARGLARLGR
ncbi:MAG: hypothetical protein ACOX2L_10205 [Anaerolineae bacterium]|jgi:hypothetical protein